MVFRLAGCLALLVAGAWADELRERDHVLVLANSRDDGSVGLARYYAERRGIPERNIVALAMPLEATISWTQYVSEVHNPLLIRLLEEGWIGAETDGTKDGAGRLVLKLKGHRIAYLVTCRGVPLRIENDDGLLESEAADLPPRYLTNHAAVDSELSLLTRTGPPTTGVITNPLYKQKEPTTRQMVLTVRVARIDGPDWASCRRLVDSAIEGERRGLIGRAYLDSGGGPREGNEWIENIGGRMGDLGFDLDWETTREKMGITDRMDAPALYFGWHSSKVVGPILNPGFSFPAGAVAVHIYSFSAGSMKLGWVARLVGTGVATTLGNVYEPYLQLTHNLALFFEAIEAGKSVGEAAWYSLPGQSWQGILIGDPLYRPFKKSFEEQWSDRNEAGPDEQYLILRRANRLKRDNRGGEAVDLLSRDEEDGVTGLALAYRLAVDSPDEENLNDLALMAAGPLRPDEWGLALDAADLLEAEGSLAEAVAVFQSLLGRTGWSEEWQQVLLERLERPSEDAEGSTTGGRE